MLKSTKRQTYKVTFLDSKIVLPQICDVGMMALAELDLHGHEQHHPAIITNINIKSSQLIEINKQYPRIESNVQPF